MDIKNKVWLGTNQMEIFVENLVKGIERRKDIEKISFLFFERKRKVVKQFAMSDYEKGVLI